VLFVNVNSLNADNLSDKLKNIEQLAYSQPDRAMKHIRPLQSELKCEDDTLHYLYTVAFIQYCQLKTELCIDGIHQLDSIVLHRHSSFRKHYLTLARIYSDRENYDDAIMCLLKAIDEDPEIREDGVSYLKLGHYYGIIGETDLEEKYMLEGYRLTNSTIDSYAKAYACNMMGMYMQRLKNDNKAIEYYQQGKQLSKSSKLWEKYIDNAIAIARIEYKRNNFQQAAYILHDAENYYSACLSPRAPAMGTLLTTQLLLTQNKMLDAERHYDLACRYSKDIRYIPYLKELYAVGIELYSNLNDKPLLLQALDNYKIVNNQAAPKQLRYNSIIDLSTYQHLTLQENNRLKGNRLWLILLIGLLSITILIILLIIVRQKRLLLLKNDNSQLIFYTEKQCLLEAKITSLEDEIKMRISKESSQKEELRLIQFLFGLPECLSSFELGPLMDIANRQSPISDNALELLRARISIRKQLNFENDTVKQYYANLELEKLNIPEKVTDRYARFFNLCLNLANNNYKISDMEHIGGTKNELYYLCKTISGKSPAQLREQITNSNFD
jgi:hypothetical protein